MQKTYGKTFREYLIITLGTAIIASAVYFFMMPSHLSVGSISGLAIVLSNFIPLPVSMIALAFNAALLVVGFIFLGRDFGAKTVYTSILLPLFLRVLEVAFPNAQSISGDALLDTVCYVFVVSIGQAILFVRNASSGGLDIVAKMMNKYLRIELGKAVSLSGMLVALSSGLIYDGKTVILSVLGTYLCGIVLDNFLFGMNIKKRVCIISPKLEEIKNFILTNLHSGATIYEAIGAYNGERRQEIITIVDKNEYAQLMRFLSQTDPTAFITVYTVSEISCQPKR